MDLQKKTLLILITFLILTIALTSIFVTLILLSNYQSLEREYVTNDLKHVYIQLNNEENTLSAIASDWAPWDETYDFVTGNNPDYITKNVNPDSFSNLHIDFMIITNSTGGIVYSGEYDPVNKTIIPVDSTLLMKITPTSPLVNQTDPHKATTGIIILPETPVLITSHLIVRTNFSGTPQGAVIMGSFLNQNQINRLASLTVPTLAYYQVDSPELPATVRSTLQNAPDTLITQPLDMNSVAGYILVRDIYNKPGLVLEITEPRDLYQEGTRTIYHFIFILLFTEMIFGFVMIFFLDHAILSRIKSLGSQVICIGSKGDRTSRVKLEGSDELSSLAGEINLMLDNIEKTNAELSTSEARYRQLAEDTSDVLITTDTKGKVLYVSPSINRYGYLCEEIISRDFLHLVYAGDRTRINTELIQEIIDCSSTITTFRLVDKWGFVHWMEAKLTISMDVFGAPTGINGVLRDFTDRKRAEQAITLANKKLNLLNNITRHDILNTITALLGSVDMAKATKNPIEREELLIQIKDLTRVIQRQIEFTREYQSVGVNSPLWQNVRDILNRAITNFAGSRITFIQDFENIEIYADPLLEKVFYNLIDNAIRYGEQITTIRFYCEISDKGLTFVCEDDGVGIPKKEKKSIFERGIGKNTGMGLFLTREILLITGIMIQETGTPGNGAKFEMIIPNSAFRFVRKSPGKNQKENDM